MQHYTLFLQFFYELNIFNSVGSFILNALAYTFFFILYKYNLLHDFNNTINNSVSGFFYTIKITYAG